MKRIVITAILATTLAFWPGSIVAQTGAGGTSEAYDSIAESIIRIRTIADIETSRTRGHSNRGGAIVRPYSVDGTGVVIGEIEVDGRREYLILTNHHVADASNYVLEEAGYLRVNPSNTLAIPEVDERSYLMRAATDSISGDDIELVEMVRRVRGDMTLMRTIGANREMTVFTGPIGYTEDEIEAGSAILTGGYPWGREKVVAVGTIEEVDVLHELGMPHHDFLIDVRIEPGQSGGPVFLIDESPNGDVEFRLIGLVHAKDRERNFAVSYRSWEEAVEDFPEVLRGRLVR